MRFDLITRLECTKTMKKHIRHIQRLPKINGSVKNVLKSFEVTECYMNIRFKFIHIKIY